jgi:Beta-lactamase class A
MRNRRNKNKTNILGIVTIFTTLIFLIASIALLMLLQIERSDNDIFTKQTNANISNLSEEITGLQTNLTDITVERDTMLGQISDLEKEKDDLVKSFTDSDKRYKELSEQLEDLHSEVNKRDVAIAKLEDDIKKLESVYSVDINAQFTILNQLNELLENPPMIKREVEVTREDGTIEKVIEEEKPRIALYYEDIMNGYKFAFNADEAFDSASLIKLPFSLAIFEKATEEYEKNKDVEGEVALKYDLNQKFTYTSAAYQSGSGKIITEPEDTEYTHLQLFEYLLLYSDNVAYNELRNGYGFEEFREMVYRIGATSMYKTLSNMSAADGGKILKEVYNFTSNVSNPSPYAELMLNSMVESAHTVMISYAVHPTKTAHKYGWDAGAYHDMGIVYDNKPYALVFLSNMEQGGKEVNEYVQSVVKLIAKLHSNFFSNK